MRKIRFIALILSRLIQKYLQRFLSGRKNWILVILCLSLAGIVWKFELLEFNRPSVSQGLIGIYTLDSLPLYVTNLLSKSLVSLDKSLKPQPDLASGWQVNNNATVYTFKLKEGLVWNDGSSLKSSDIKFNLPETETSYPNSSTIEFKLADSFAPFPTFLTSPVFKENSLIGLGKYKLAQTKVSQGVAIKLVLRPKEDKSLPRITIRFYPDEKTARTAFELGEIDALIGGGEPETFKNQPLLAFKKLTTFNKLTAIFYNTKDNLLSDKNLRRALSFASPSMPFEERAKTPIPPVSWAYNHEAKNYLNNLEMAKTYLDKVSLNKEDQIILTTIPTLKNLGETIINVWKQIGIPSVLRIESGIPQNFQALLIQESIPFDPDQYLLWHSTQTKTNPSKYSSPRIDKDLEDGRKSADLEIRKEKYLDFQKVLVEDAPATFLYFPKLNIIYRSKIEENLNKILPLQIPSM